MLETYRAHVEERAQIGIVPKPISPEQMNDLVELIKNPPGVKKRLFMIYWLTEFQLVWTKQHTSKRGC